VVGRTQPTPVGTEIGRFAGSGTSIGKLRNPRQISLDAAGNLWVADRRPPARRRADVRDQARASTRLTVRRRTARLL